MEFVEVFYETQLVAAPVQEPLTLPELKAYLRLTASSEDGLLNQAIARARGTCEQLLGRSIALQTLETVFTIEDVIFSEYEAEFDSTPRVRLELPLGPLATVSSVKYESAVATWTALDTSLYKVDATGVHGSIYLLSGALDTITGTGLAPIRIKITYTAGYSDTSLISPTVMTAMYTLAAAYYLYREGSAELADAMRNVQSILPRTPHI